MLCKRSVSKYRAKGSYNDHFAPGRGQRGRAIDKLKKLTNDKIKINSLLWYSETVVYDHFLHFKMVDA